ncbi:hypothetical protein GCM10023172_01280 [Hymenobacter ginsengisoli]|uniref:DUF3500 domain-containing protein n=1 Tax=Hymenobacter ginsengisoli TaxID=1051626 RepID=A0ABP8PX77_9BACT|nr:MULTISPECIES: DUF3500 domain-containing protein [unclassified Hymenobacter]MBO2033523.1 DUF3500 domain-containing protein [Hymenobacter sp. BT559]
MSDHPPLRRGLLLAAGLFGFAAFKLAPGHSKLPAAAPVLAHRSSSLATKADVVAAANAFLATLSAEQRQVALVAYADSNVTKWSNLPVGLAPRVGLQLRHLSPAQVTAALAVVRAATGTVAGNGFNEIEQIRAADDNLSVLPQGPPPGGSPSGGPAGSPTVGPLSAGPPGSAPSGQTPGPGGPPPGSRPPGGGPGRRGFPGGRRPIFEYSSGIYFIAFLGQPSSTGTWMLQFGGHHLGTNITFHNGQVTGATPKFEGTEPLRFTTTDNKVLPTGTVCEPMADEASAMRALLASLTPTQQTHAKLTQSFDDVLLGPGQDGQFPKQKVGVPVSALSAKQQQLVVAAMAPWVQDADDATATALLADYKKQLASTYVAYAGTGQLTSHADYVRLDGPRVWIEFVCQNGILYRNQIHYHSIWRDHLRDYGGNFYTVR